MKIRYLLLGVLLIGAMAFAWFSLNTPDMEITEVEDEMANDQNNEDDDLSIEDIQNLNRADDGATLDLSGQNLSSVDAAVFSRTELTSLDLSDNNLSGALQAEVRNLRNLQVLDLSDNDFTGVPAEVGQLSELRVLDLSNNPITGLPHEISNLKNLEVLDLRGTDYSEQDLQTIIAGGLSSDVEIRR